MTASTLPFHPAAPSAPGNDSLDRHRWRFVFLESFGRIERCLGGLCPGDPSATTTYQVTVSAGACSRVLSTTVTVSDIQLTGNVTAPLCSGGGNGAIDLTVSGGIPPYQCSWTGPGGYTLLRRVVNIGAGTYSVLVTDANGCNRTRSFSREPAGASCCNAHPGDPAFRAAHLLPRGRRGPSTSR